MAAASLARDAIMPLADGDVYFDLIKATMSVAARKAFEMLPATYEYQDESLRRSYLKGRTSTVISFLKARGIELTEADEEKITACQDPDQLERLITKAATAQTAAELFE